MHRGGTSHNLAKLMPIPKLVKSITKESYRRPFAIQNTKNNLIMLWKEHN